MEPSPSPRRAWIEITSESKLVLEGWMSPSPRRAWIEIYIPPRQAAKDPGRPPHGGRG